MADIDTVAVRAGGLTGAVPEVLYLLSAFICVTVLVLYACWCHGLRLSDLIKETTYLLSFLACCQLQFLCVHCPGEAESHLRLIADVVPAFLRIVRLKSGEYVKIDQLSDLTLVHDSIQNIIKALWYWRRSHAIFICLVTNTLILLNSHTDQMCLYAACIYR